MKYWSDAVAGFAYSNFIVITGAKINNVNTKLTETTSLKEFMSCFA